MKKLAQIESCHRDHPRTLNVFSDDESDTLNMEMVSRDDERRLEIWTELDRDGARSLRDTLTAWLERKDKPPDQEIPDQAINARRLKEALTVAYGMTRQANSKLAPINAVCSVRILFRDQNCVIDLELEKTQLFDPTKAATSLEETLFK